jgi:hypothetical protein
VSSYLRQIARSLSLSISYFVLFISVSRFTCNLHFKVSYYVTSSLRRGCVCSLQLLLALAKAFILRFESRGIHDHMLLSQIQDSPNLEGQVPIFISPGKGCPSYNLRQWVPFTSLPTTHRATVEVLDPASTQDADWLHGPSRNSTLIVACVSVAAGTCLLSHCLETNAVQ